MTQPLSFEEFKALAQHAGRIAVFREIPIGKLTPIQCYRLLSDVYGENGVMLENLRKEESNRYSYICFDSIASLVIHQDDNENPLNKLRALQSQFAMTTRNTVSGLINCAMGLMTYDVARYFEKIPDRHQKDLQLPVLLFNFYALSLTFDHENQTLLISKVVQVSDDHEADYEKAQQTINETINLFSLDLLGCDLALMLETEHGSPRLNASQPRDDAAFPEINIDISDFDFMDKVEKAKEYIMAGDAFQIVLSRCFKREYSVSPLQIYKTLCRVSPSPFMFYFPVESGVILGASPERLISVIDRQVVVNPIAGTRKRTADSTDEEIALDLLSDEKELAEHMMLVDLARNDVGAVSVPGSIVVNELLNVKHYSHVSHITSNVTGLLHEKYDAYDAFSAAFPAGTLSGAPKIRAMEIIDELETSRRGMYGGAICRIDVKGNFDSCIAIRMALLRDGIATIRVGAGIVYDSNPASEAQETHQKAQSMLHAIALAHGEYHDTNHR